MICKRCGWCCKAQFKQGKYFPRMAQEAKEDTSYTWWCDALYYKDGLACCSDYENRPVSCRHYYCEKENK